MQKPFIGVSGLIGAGKTTLARKLSEHYGVPLYKEPVEENEYLDKFYKDPAKYGFAMQVYLLNYRFEAHQKLVWGRFGGIQDRTIYEDKVFAEVLSRQGNISKEDYKVYRHLARNMFSFLYEPDLILHLDVSPETALNRIVERGRASELFIPLAYLELLHEVYQDFLEERQKRVRVLRLDYNEFLDFEDVVSKIDEALEA